MNRFAFLTQAAHRSRMPVALLSGFLGSGKTTLVNALLRDPRMAGTAVAVNEFGDVPLDRDLIDHGADKTVVMANGCLCCNLAGDMEDAVMRLFSRREDGQIPQFQRLVIEPSGLSDPAPIAQAILRNPVMSRAMRLETIITTVDALFAEAQMVRHPETRKQVALADRLVLTKTDLLYQPTMTPTRCRPLRVMPTEVGIHAFPATNQTHEWRTGARHEDERPVPMVQSHGPLASGTDAVDRLRLLLRDQNPAAPILVAANGAIDAATLFPPSFFNPDGPAPPPLRSGLFAENVDPGHIGRHAAVSLTADRPLGWRTFDDWLRRIRIGHAEHLLRIKGMLDIAGVDGPVVVQGVHHVLNAPVELDAWPEGQRRSRLVLIADRATIAAARESWAAALPAMTASK
ncbi:MAG: GTP-binding protein [Rhodopila sp.]